jgi:streptomycin 6-kinase
MTLPIPARLRSAGSDGGRAGWLAALPAVVEAAAVRWTLQIMAPYEPGGRCAWVAPARSETGDRVVVKVGWPHPESAHEAEGLALWAGAGCVRLLDAAEFDGVPVLLLEPCVPGTPLSAAVAEPARDPVVAELLRRLWRVPPDRHSFRPLAQMCRQWADHAEQALAPSQVDDPGLVRAGITLFRELPQSGTDQVVLFTDLHADNVLAAAREPWLAIDPKPYLGDPCYDVLQHMLNCDRLRSEPERLARRMADLAGLDVERVLLWTYARCAVDAVDDPELYDVAARLAP